MSTAFAIFIGLIGGLTSGLLGLGGGVIFVPLLVYLKSFDIHLAVGTSLAVIVPTAAAGVMRHQMSGMVHWPTVIFIAVFAILGAWLGAALSLKMPVLLLKRVFAAFLLVMAFKMFFQK